MGADPASDRADFDAAFEAVVTDLFQWAGLPVPPLAQAPKNVSRRSAAAKARWEREARRRRLLAAKLRAARRADARRGRM